MIVKPKKTHRRHNSSQGHEDDDVEDMIINSSLSYNVQNFIPRNPFSWNKICNIKLHRVHNDINNVIITKDIIFVEISTMTIAVDNIDDFVTSRCRRRWQSL